MTDDNEGCVDVALDFAGVATVSFANPPANYFDLKLLTTLADELERLDADPACRSVLLSARGRHFCTGMNFKDSPIAEPDSARALPAIYECGLRLFGVSKPIVAAMQGKTIGGGFGFALTADFRVMADDATVCANFSRLGLFPGFGLTVSLEEVVGRQAARDLLMTGRWVCAHEAQRLGLVDRVTSADCLLTAAADLAGELAGAAPLSITALKRQLDLGRRERLSTAMTAEYAVQRELGRTSDFVEGFRAWRDKRAPNFTGS